MLTASRGVRICRHVSVPGYAFQIQLQHRILELYLRIRCLIGSGLYYPKPSIQAIQVLFFLDPDKVGGTNSCALSLLLFPWQVFVKILVGSTIVCVSLFSEGLSGTNFSLLSLLRFPSAVCFVNISFGTSMA